MWNFNSIGREASAYKPYCYGCMQSTGSIELLDPTKRSRLLPLTHKRQKVPRLLQGRPQSDFMSHSQFPILSQSLFSFSLFYPICHMAVFSLILSVCCLLWFVFWFNFVFLFHFRLWFCWGFFHLTLCSFSVI